MWHTDLLKRLQASRTQVMRHAVDLSITESHGGFEGPLYAALIDASFSLLLRIETLQREIADECLPWFWVRFRFDRENDTLTPVHPWRDECEPWRPLLAGDGL